MGKEYIPSSYFEETTGKSFDKIIENRFAKSPIKEITESVEKAKNKKVGISSDFGLKYEFLDSGIDKYLE